MNLKKIIVTLLVTLVMFPAQAQKNKNLAKAVDAAVSRQVAKQVPGQVITTRTGTYFYHPVFGYVPSPKVPFYYPDIHFAARETLPTNDDEFIQRAPLFKHQLDPIRVGPRAAFDEGIFIDFETITQASYFWRVAHPEKSLQDNPYLYDWAKLHLKQIQAEQTVGERIMWQFPNYVLLKRMMSPHFTPTSYAQLYELTPVYPKHITLNAGGFPVKTADDDYANILDTYLMLSNPQETSQYNTYGKYTPLILTQEEHAAADKLLALRAQGEKLPANPTPRDVLEVAYNRLETHPVPFSQIVIEDIQCGITGPIPTIKIRNFTAPLRV